MMNVPALLIVVAVLGAIAALCLPIAWARWLRRRLPDDRTARSLPWLIGVALAAPLALGVPDLLDQLITVLQAVPHVNPVYKQAVLAQGLREIVDHAKTMALILAVLYLSSLIVLAVVTGIEWRDLRDPPS